MGVAARAREFLEDRPRRLQEAIRRSRHLRPRGLFVWRELRKAPVLGSYRLRVGGARIRLRHDRLDGFLVGELLDDRIYDIPAPARAALGPPDQPIRALDLGANIGLSIAILLRAYPRAIVRAYEPDPGSVAVLREFARSNGLGSDRLEIVEACAGARDGTIGFVADASPLSRAVAPGERSGAGVVERPLRDVFRHLHEAEFVKIDIEGGEWPILRDGRFESIPARALVAEVHPDADLAAAPPEVAAGVLEAAGFHVEEVSGARRPDGTAVLWAWRP